LARRPSHDDAEQIALRHLDGTRGLAVAKPRDSDEAPFQKELCRQRRDGEINAFDAEQGYAEQRASSSGGPSQRLSATSQHGVLPSAVLDQQ